ncbi:DUF397 domain-containing protein [Streptomyces sp. NPDC057592]
MIPLFLCRCRFRSVNPRAHDRIPPGRRRSAARPGCRGGGEHLRVAHSPIPGPVRARAVAEQLNHRAEQIASALASSPGCSRSPPVHTPLLHSAVALLPFTDAPAVACTESAYGGQLVEDPPLVRSTDPHTIWPGLPRCRRRYPWIGSCRRRRSSRPDTVPDLSTASGRTSSYTNGDGGECVEVADNVPGFVPVRDTKLTDSPVLPFRAPVWAAFVQSVKR